MAAKDRPFTQLAAAMMGNEAVKHLNKGNCPFCGSDDKVFRNEMSAKENTISNIISRRNPAEKIKGLGKLQGLSTFANKYRTKTT